MVCIRIELGGNGHKPPGQKSPGQKTPRTKAPPDKNPPGPGHSTSGDIFYCSGSRQLNHSSSPMRRLSPSVLSVSGFGRCRYDLWFGILLWDFVLKCLYEMSACRKHSRVKWKRLFTQSLTLYGCFNLGKLIIYVRLFDKQKFIVYAVCFLSKMFISTGPATRNQNQPIVCL